MDETFIEWGIQYCRYRDGQLVGQHVGEYGEDEAEARKDMARRMSAGVTKTLVSRTVTYTAWEPVLAQEVVDV